jgi:hypothetical protein
VCKVSMRIGRRWEVVKTGFKIGNWVLEVWILAIADTMIQPNGVYTP